MPDKLKLPGTVKGAGVEKVDVVTFLNLKRVNPLLKKN